MLGYMHHDRPGVLVPPEDGWYDTGDIVEVGEEGFVTILGRVKRFAKLGGEMVSLAAVEELATALRPEAGHAAIALPDPRKGERIVLVTTDPALDRTMLLEAARRRGRPEFMVPAEVIPVPELPLLGSGKTNYPAVQQLVSANTDQRTE
jgi:acyl-[acyl-carrier-protein]-phospholipid O-acyltransferase/long-chain-fatty-acid--[acyl-carrier-protein] ligase